MLSHRGQDRSFLVLFFKKEPLPYLYAKPPPIRADLAAIELNDLIGAEIVLAAEGCRHHHMSTFGHGF